MEACEKIAPLTEKIHSIAAGIEMMRRFMDIPGIGIQSQGKILKMVPPIPAKRYGWISARGKLTAGCAAPTESKRHG
jgi:hypothetical protein